MSFEAWILFFLQGKINQKCHSNIHLPGEKLLLEGKASCKVYLESQKGRTDESNVVVTNAESKGYDATKVTCLRVA